MCLNVLCGVSISMEVLSVLFITTERCIIVKIRKQRYCFAVITDARTGQS